MINEDTRDSWGGRWLERLRQDVRFAARLTVKAPAFSTALSAMLVCLGASSAGHSALAPAWKLVWSDEFNEADGSAPNARNWAYDTGGNGWGNHELQYYTDRSPTNVAIQNGKLIIHALKETYTGRDGVTRQFTSARLKTLGRFDQAYGRFEARIKIPYGTGLWPAFWMLGNNIKEVGWPDCGEIDIMENVGKEPSTIHGTLHGPGYSGGSGISASHPLPGSQRFASDFHVFAAEWEPGVIRFYADDALYKTATPADLPAGKTWIFDHPFFLILNVAVGGDWPGSPDASTMFPQSMAVDYVRVYERLTRTRDTGLRERKMRR